MYKTPFIVEDKYICFTEGPYKDVWFSFLEKEDVVSEKGPEGENENLIVHISVKDEKDEHFLQDDKFLFEIQEFMLYIIDKTLQSIAEKELI